MKTGNKNSSTQELYIYLGTLRESESWLQYASVFFTPQCQPDEIRQSLRVLDSEIKSLTKDFPFKE